MQGNHPDKRTKGLSNDNYLPNLKLVSMHPMMVYSTYTPNYTLGEFYNMVHLH